MDEQTYHYPPDLLNLLVDAVALLVKSKPDVVVFFRGAGVPESMLRPWAEKIRQDRENVRKTDITKDVLCQLNELGDRALRTRREVIKRVVEWEDFSSCYPDKQLAAQGLVARVQRLLNVKDSFTRINVEREKEKSATRQAYRAGLERKTAAQMERDRIRDALFALYAETNVHRRGKALEGILNGFFTHCGILVKEAFTLNGEAGEGALEQIDGVVQLDGDLYLVEMKWWNERVGPGPVGSHLSRLFGRAEARGLFISASGFTAAGVKTAKDALGHRVCVLCELEEIVDALRNSTDFCDVLRKKVQAVITDKIPLSRPVGVPWQP